MAMGALLWQLREAGQGQTLSALYSGQYPRLSVGLPPWRDAIKLSAGGRGSIPRVGVPLCLVCPQDAIPCLFHNDVAFGE